MHHLKQCKKDHNHVYFTSKGCGLCMMEEKFTHDMSDIRRQLHTPEKIRGIEVSKLSFENMQKDKKEKAALNTKMQKISWAIIGLYMLFFTFLSPMLKMGSSFFSNISLGIQGIVTTCIMILINRSFHKYSNIFPIFKNKSITDMLQVYALICIIIALVSVNDIPKNLLDLAP